MGGASAGPHKCLVGFAPRPPWRSAFRPWHQMNLTLGSQPEGWPNELATLTTKILSLLKGPQHPLILLRLKTQEQTQFANQITLAGRSRGSHH